MHRPLRRQHQPEQADLLRPDYSPLRARPMGVRVPSCQQVRQLGDDPVGLDARAHQAPYLLRVQQGCDQ